MVPAIALTVSAILFAPGVLETLDLSLLPSYLVGDVEFHYSMVVDPGRKLAQGHPLFSETRAAYGLVMPLLVGLWERTTGPHSAATYVRLVQASQIALVAIWTLTYVRRSRGELTRALPAFLLAAGAFNAVGAGHLQPNQSGWRFLALAVVPLAADLLADATPRGRAVAFGALAVFALLFNTETGVAVTAALGAYLYLRGGWAQLHVMRRVTDLGGLLLGAVAGLAAFLASWRLALGAWPELLHPHGLLAFLGGVSGGFGGLRLTPSPVALALLAHPIYVLVSVGSLGPRPLDHTKAFRGLVATMMVVWFAYYAHRPHVLNLASFLALWGFLVIDTIPLARRYRTPGAVLAVGLAWVVSLANLARALPYAAVAFAHIAQGPGAADARRVSGIWLSDDAASRVEQRAKRVTVEAAHGPVWYFTSDSWLVPLQSGVYAPTPNNGAFFLATDAHRDALLAQIAKSRPPRLLFDAPNLEAPDDPIASVAFAALRHDLAATYVQVEVADGWYVLDRRGP